MSQFNEYAQQFDAIAKENLSKYEAARNECEDAKRLFENCRPDGTAVKTAEKEYLKAAYMQKEEKFRKLKNELDGNDKYFKDVRAGLENAVAEAYSMDSDYVDEKVMTLLNSGLMTANEYEKLLEKQLAKGNITMARVIAGAAKMKADNVKDRDEARALRAVAALDPKRKSRIYIDNLDAMMSVYFRAIKNPALIKMWDKLIGEAIRNF